ncbi:hypothetical protein MSPP1_003654 [Malassezia sp. CBS 17886]|nr:hypothetical protein MSPP1_003654 [Malassezia sp. CBS 17886]
MLMRSPCRARAVLAHLRGTPRAERAAAHVRVPTALLAPRAVHVDASADAAREAFAIPEEPIDIARADTARAQAAAEQARTSAAAHDPAGEQDALQRNVRRMQRGMLSDMAGLASTQTRDSSFRPFKLRTQPQDPAALTLSHLLAATAELGHEKSQVLQSYEPYLYGMRHGVAVIDVERATLPALRRAVHVVRGTTENDGVVLIVGTKAGLQPAIRSAVGRLGANGFHVSTDRWVPGVLTNAPKLLAPAIQHSVSRAASGGAQHDEDAPNTAKLASQLYKPDLVIVLNPVDNAHALREATQCNIPTMAIVDTNVDPRAVTYAIPANDDSLRVAELLLGVLSKAGEDGLRRRAAAADAWDKRQRNMRRRPNKGGKAKGRAE